jgi:hypothetical protein
MEAARFYELLKSTRKTVWCHSPENPVILSVIHHRQNPLESTVWMLRIPFIIEFYSYRDMFLATDPEVPGSIPGDTRFSDK